MIDHAPVLARSLAVFALVLVPACGPPPAAQPHAPVVVASAAPQDCTGAFGTAASMQLDRSKLVANGAPPRLLSKIDASAHRYFRLLAIEFSSRVCFEFRELRWRLPVVAIHGDAHVEQFVTTPTTFGLEDYDQAGFGPAVVDLVRFASSIHLLCREVKWPCNASAAVESFFRAYRESLDKPPERRLPSIVERVRKRTPKSPEAWLAWTESISPPLPAALESTTKQHWAEFVKLQKEVAPERPRQFYDVVRVGGLQLGTGSALEAKLLFRVRGASDSPTDDVILEARATTPPAPNTCVWRPSHGGSMQALMFMSILGPRMPQLFGTAPLDAAPNAPEFWVQAWEPGYYELAISDLESQTDLEELGIDAARQLAGHFWTRFPEPLRPTQRFAQRSAFDLSERRARELAKNLSDETVQGWERFRATK